MTLLKNMQTMVRQGAERPVEEPVAAAPPQRVDSAEQPADVVASGLPPGFLAQKVRTVDCDSQERRGMDGGFIHVSTLVRDCLRAVALQNKFGSVQDKVGSSDRIVWAMGRAAEEHVRRQLIASSFRSELFGVWRCLCRRSSRQGRLDDSRCESCGGSVDNYVELTVAIPQLGVIGNPDLLLWQDNKLVVVEIKSSDRAKFDKTKEPEPEHVLQAALYAHLISKDYPVHTHVVLFYVCRGYLFFGSSYKEFHVPRAEWQDKVAIKMQDSMELHQSVQRGTLPSRVVCSTPESPEAKKCPVAARCFSVPG